MEGFAEGCVGDGLGGGPADFGGGEFFGGGVVVGDGDGF